MCLELGFTENDQRKPTALAVGSSGRRMWPFDFIFCVARVFFGTLFLALCANPFTEGASKQSRLRAWAVLQRIRAILSESGMVIEQPSKKTFESEGAILERALAKCIRDRQAALRDLADAARRVDKAAFGQQADFGPSHQALLKALDRAADFI